MPDTLVAFLQDVANRFGNRPALYFKPGFRYQRWSYTQVWEDAGRVATLLRERGVTTGDRVLIWAPNCPQWVLAYFGTIRAGAIVVPLDLRSASDFVTRVVERTQPKVAFVSRATPDADERRRTAEIAFEDLPRLVQGRAQPPDPQVRPDDVMEVMFTSGTTGNPKGVMLTHRNLLADLDGSSVNFPGKPTDRLLSVLPLSHMYEQMGTLLSALRCGANITYPTSRQPTVLLRTMRERRVTMMLLVPQALDLLMKGIEREVERQGKTRAWRLMLRLARRLPRGGRRLLFHKVHQRFGGRLEVVVSGGAALDPELGAKWDALGIKIVQGYGATEASPVISSHRRNGPRFDSVGVPVPCNEVRIADDGEVQVRGANVTPGYWQMPEQTVAAFQDGWYRTGDLGFFDRQGFLHIQGRKKDMIVLANGQNVFPEDVEMALKKHPAVVDACVVGVKNGAAVDVHAALIMQDPRAAPEAVAWANGQIAEHQQVRGFTVWFDPDFPRTHTLKVKKNVVADILNGVAPRHVGAVDMGKAAGTRGVRDLVAEVGGIPLAEVVPGKRLGLDLKLDSLKRVELLSAVEEELGVSLDEGQIGPETTVEQLDALVRSGTRGAEAGRFPRWGMSWWCRPLRGALQRALVFPLMRVMYRLRASGTENLEGLTGPVLIAGNHTLHLDSSLILKAMPSHFRRQVAIAATAAMWESWSGAFFTPLLGNAFPFSKGGNVRASLENLGSVLDQGWSVMIYPEGERSMDGMMPFKSGTGLIAVESGIPVVPLYLDVRRRGFPFEYSFLRRSHIEVRFGKPITFPPGASYLDATKTLQEAVAAL